MKTIKLLSLELTNFKGIKSKRFEFDGKDTNIYGANEAGKTTVFDAFTWLLFNKDSQNKTDFQIKTMENDVVINKLNHEVEAVLMVNDQSTTLKKVLKEKWTKPRGKAEHIFGGHTTEYSVDEVPCSKKEFDDKVEEIIRTEMFSKNEKTENVFKLLTNPNEFNINVHWKDRRNLLFEIAGDITDEDVIAADQDLSKLMDVLKGRSIDDLKKIIANKRKEIDEKLKELPTRIDEAHRSKPDTSTFDKDSIASDIDKLTIDIEEKNNEINTIKLGTATNELKRKVSDIELEIVNVINEHKQNEQEALFKLKTKLQEEQSNHQILQGDVRNLMQQKEMNDRDILSGQERMNELRNEYGALSDDAVKQNELKFVHDDSCVCPTCDQDLPQNKIDEAIAKFNKNKSDLLESIKNRQQEINETGSSIKTEVDKLQEENERLQIKIDRVTENGQKKVADIERIEKQIEEAESAVKPIEENKKYIKLNQEKQELQKEIVILDQSVDESVNKIKKEIESFNNEREGLQIKLRHFDDCDRINVRINELEAEERKLTEESEELEHQLYLTEEFTRKKVEMITENINEKFQTARFKLFEEQINGGVNETCYVIGKNGEPFEDINTAYKINVSLDIINTLSKHYGVQAPIFIDNAESVTNLIDVETQLISLVVSKKDKQLRIEIEGEKESGVA